MNRTGIVVVTYNSEEDIGACLEAAVQTQAPVVVVDNASRDRTCEIVRRHQGVRLIANSTNRGFAGAVNQGVRALAAPNILILNPDTQLMGSPDALEEAALAPRVAAVGGCLVGEDGQPQQGFTVRRFPTALALAFEILGLNRLWPGNPVNRLYRCLDVDLSQPAEGLQPAGAFLLLRREAWEELGGFDESFYPVWFEEVDFLQRASRAGWRILYTPEATARHAGGTSVRQVPREKRQLYWYASLLGYAIRHFNPVSFRLLCLTLILASPPRAFADVLTARNLGPVKLHLRVIRMACGSLWRKRVESGQPLPLLA